MSNQSDSNQNSKPAPKPRVWTRDTVAKDGYDPVLWDCVKGGSSVVRGLAGRADERDVAMSDVFHSLYKTSPTLVDGAEGKPKSIMKTMMALPEYRNLREYTRHDDITSAMGLVKLAPSVLEQIQTLEKEEAEKGPQAKKPGRKPAPQGQPGAGPAGDDEGADSQGTPAPGDADQQPGDQDAESDDEDGLPAEQKSAARQAIRKALQEAQEKAEQWDEVRRAWGIKPGDLVSLPFEEKMKLVDSLMNQPDLRAIADLLGRFRNIVHATEAMTTAHGLDELVDIVQGNDLAHLLPVEFAKFKFNRKQFFKDYAERQLLQYDLRGVEPAGCGPVIALVDISQSMGGQREIWAKAVVLSLMALAEKQKRPFAVVTFDAKVRQKWVWTGHPIPLKSKLDLAGIMSEGGGTDFYPPLKEAFKIRQELGLMKPADIVHITDGECRLEDKQLKEILSLKQETEVRIYGIGIADGRYDNAAFADLELFCDNVSMINHLGELSHVKGIMAQVAAKTNRVA